MSLSVAFGLVRLTALMFGVGISGCMTNGDECVTVKSPAKNILIEKIHCSISGGTASGSLDSKTSVSSVSYKNLYMNQADACYLKSNGGSGTVSGIVWDTVYIDGGQYALAVNEK